MQFDPNNNIVKLCAKGMEMEGKGEPKEAKRLFLQAWNEATSNFERCTAAHYVARHQNSVAEKLKWDKTALQSALMVNDGIIKEIYPSLYLNIAKCYEDLNDYCNARKNYRLALSFTQQLTDNGYGNMIRGGIIMGMERIERIDPKVANKNAAEGTQTRKKKLETKDKI